MHILVLTSFNFVLKVSTSVSGDNDPLLPLVKSKTSTVGASSPSSGVDPWDK